ncbi:hypothetical protein NFI96_032849 [Prochilodus magdalenae]|nr:hypothetical protein NFI96_032849 [Prochilodus magdalenae]
MSDNGPQYSCELFRDFTKEYGFTHCTSSPRYAQANGEAERAVATIKGLWKGGEEKLKPLMTYRATPLECGYSPVQLLMGRQLRTTIPQLPTYLHPRWPNIRGLRKADMRAKENQQRNYNLRHRARHLQPLQAGQKVWLAKEKKSGTVIQQATTPRSYIIDTDEAQRFRAPEDVAAGPPASEHVPGPPAPVEDAPGPPAPVEDAPGPPAPVEDASGPPAPETPAVNPETPAVNPETPAVNPETPAVNPETHARPAAAQDVAAVRPPPQFPARPPPQFPARSDYGSLFSSMYSPCPVSSCMFVPVVTYVPVPVTFSVNVPVSPVLSIPVPVTVSVPVPTVVFVPVQSPFVQSHVQLPFVQQSPVQ